MEALYLINIAMFILYYFDPTFVKYSWHPTKIYFSK